MASVTGVTAARMEQIEDNTIVSARVENGILYFKKGDNVTEFNVGKIVLPPIDSWPVGSIFFNTTSTNPAALLGGGVWARYAQGRMLVGVKDRVNNQPNRFESVGSEGGLETVTLSPAEMPWHNHDGLTGNQDRDHTHTGYAHPNGQHTHGEYKPYNRTVANGQATGADSSGYISQTDPAGWHDHSVTTNGASTGHHHGIAGAGGGQAHENMSPYITVYMWRRTG